MWHLCSAGVTVESHVPFMVVAALKFCQIISYSVWCCLQPQRNTENPGILSTLWLSFRIIVSSN
jgi:hypothetical protein